MRTRFRKRVPAELREESSVLSRIPQGVVWSLLAVVVLLLVLGYDKHVQRRGLSHAEFATELEHRQLYPQAIEEYRKALDNPRLRRKAKARIALRIANIYYDHFEDYDRAQMFFARARHEHPRSVDPGTIKKRMETAQQRISRSGTVPPPSGTTATVIRRVELISQPGRDLEGPVLARLRGQEIHAGEVDRALGQLRTYRNVFLQSDPKQFEQFVSDYLDRALLCRAAVDAGYHRETGISERLYDFQRTLITERYVRDVRRKAQVVSNDRVEQFYEENRDKFVEPARIVLAMIKTDSPDKAREALEKLRAGADFSDVSTSYSVDVASRRADGVVGNISEREDFIPGLGRDPQVLKTLFEMGRNDVTGVTRVGDSYCIFKIISKLERRDPTLDEVRHMIEATLRGKAVDEANQGLGDKLREEYEAQLDADGLSAYWEYAARKTREETQQSTQTLAGEKNTSAAQPGTTGASGKR